MPIMIPPIKYNETIRLLQTENRRAVNNVISKNVRAVEKRKERHQEAEADSQP